VPSVGVSGSRLRAGLEVREEQLIMETKPNSAELFERACRCMPGGVNSPVRAWSAVGGVPRIVESAAGVELCDVDGCRYLDFTASWGPLIAGHAHPRVVESVSAALEKGSSFGATTRGEIELAERLCGRFSSLEKLRLVSSGTEATMSALRLARAATGRDSVVKFAGCYHGHSDGLLVRAGSGATTLGIPDSPGVPAAVGGLTRVARYNDLESVRAACDGEVAAVIVEPVAGNMGVVPPREGFLEGLREITESTGALLIFDEVITGLRLSPGGWQQLSGVTPDLTCLGKVIGGGLPVGAYGGRADLMDQVAPNGPVYQAGTLSGNPLAVAAGLATLDLLEKDGCYERLEELGKRLGDGLGQAVAGQGCVQRVGSMLTLFFGVAGVADYDDALSLDAEAYGRFFHAMLDRGVWLPPSAYEAWFVSTVHSDEHVDRAVDAAGAAMAEVL